MQRALAIAGLSVACACGPAAGPCHDGLAVAGEVCFSEGAAVDDGGAHWLIDFDGDGIADLLALHEELTRFWHNRGDATFEMAGEIANVELGGTPFVIRDLDQDGRDELGVFGEPELDSGATSLSIFSREPGGSVQPQRVLELRAPGHTYGHVLGDFDGDGARDLVIHGDDRIVLLHRRGESFAAPIELEPFGIDANGQIAPRVGDLNGDGVDELCHAWTGGLRVRSGIDLADERILPWPREVTDAVLGDIDADGRDEVVAWWIEERPPLLHGVVLEHSVESDALVDLTTFAHEAFFVALADLDGNGAEDLVLPGEAFEGKLGGDAWFRAQAGHVRLADGLGGFHEPVRVEGLDGRSWTPAHLDDDGRIDLAAFSCPPEPGYAPCPVYEGSLRADP